MKYKLLTDDTIELPTGVTLYRIRACRRVRWDVPEGTLGGYVQNRDNLSLTEGKSWIYGGAKVYGSAEVYGDAKVYGNAEVHSTAEVCGDAKVYGDRATQRQSNAVYRSVWRRHGTSGQCTVTQGH